MLGGGVRGREVGGRVRVAWVGLARKALMDDVVMLMRSVIEEAYSAPVTLRLDLSGGLLGQRYGRFPPFMRDSAVR